MHILLIGAGDVGFQLGKRLSRERHDITIVEQDPRRVKRASEQLDGFVIEGDAASYDVLKQAGLAHIDVVAAMTDHDNANLMACKIAKKAGVATTIARVRNQEYTAPDFILSHEELGADYIIHPEREAANAVINLLHESSADYAVEFEGGRIQLLGMHVERGSPLLYTPLIELGQRQGNPPSRIVAINRNHKTIIPHGYDTLNPGDQVFVVCDHDYAPEFKTLAGKTEAPIANAMILGGGLIGHFIATSLQDEMNMKIVEGNEERAEKLADILPKTLIIHGDGTDFDLLNEEGLDDMDAFVAVTGDDEKNIITTLLARHAKVRRIIALVNKVEYLPIMSTIGLDTAVSKQLLTVNAVERVIQRQQVASIASLPGINAQLIEYIAKDGCKITRKPLKDVGFPKNAIIGAIMHDEKMVVPRGDTQIQPGDRTIIFSLPQAVNAVEKLFGCNR